VVIIEVKKTKRLPGWLKQVSEIALILAGVLLMVFGPPEFSSDALKYEKLAELNSGEAGFPGLGGQYPAQRLTRYRIGSKTGGGVEMNVAHYRDGQDKPASAIVYSPALSTLQGSGPIRHELWEATAKAILLHTGEDALFVTWWDDAQRIRFLTGRDSWIDAPVATAFPDNREKKFWQQASGGFSSDGSKLKQLARWLATDADLALAEMEKLIPKNQPAYFLTCLDDLARLGEIEALSGVKMPFEARYFPQSANIHNQIAEVKRWAGENGSASYLVQQLPAGGVRAWRITTEDGMKTLFARLLPFTSSLANPLPNQLLVYQTGWGGYLSVYQWQR